MKLFSIYDIQSKTYSHPIPMETERDAQFGFAQQVNNDKTPYFHYPEDFNLCLIGSYDIRTAHITTQVPETIINAAKLKKTMEAK